MHFRNENCCNLIKIWLKFVPKGQISSLPVLVLIMPRHFLNQWWHNLLQNTFYPNKNAFRCHFLSCWNVVIATKMKFEFICHWILTLMFSSHIFTPMCWSELFVQKSKIQNENERAKLMPWFKTLHLQSLCDAHIWYILSNNHSCWCCTMISWWRHQMKHFPVTGPLYRKLHRSSVNSPHQGQWRGAWIFFIYALNKRLSKHSRSWWFGTPSRSLWRHYNVANPP